LYDHSNALVKGRKPVTKFTRVLVGVLVLVILSFVCALFYFQEANNINSDPSKPNQLNSKATSKKSRDSRKVIGVSVMNYVNEYWIDFINGIKAYCADAGIEVIPVDVKDNMENQKKSLEDFIANDVDGIIVAPISETAALEQVIHKAMEQGIKIITHHDLKEFNVFNGPNEYAIGITAGRCMGRLLKEKGIEKPKLAMLNYPYLGTLFDREKGLEDGLREFVPEATIVSKNEGYTPELGEKAAKEIIKDYPFINGFVGINDNGLLGALKASDELGLSKRDDFMIVGIGGDNPALQMIKEGTPFKATVFIDPWQNGYNDAEIMHEMFEGKEYINKVIYFSSINIIDSSNVDELINEKERRKRF